MSATATIPTLLAAAAEDRPHACLLRTADGDLSYREVADRSASLAGALAELGVGPDTRVALLMRNSAEQVLVWFALARLGALHIPINTALVGPPLAHVLAVCDPALLVVDHDLIEAVEAVGGHPRLVVFGGQPEPQPAAGHVSLEALLSWSGPPAPVHPVDELATATLLFTSGTTGLSKACMLSHRYLVRQGQIHARQFGLRADDVLYCPFPLFHVDAATLTVVAALAVGATAAIGERFSVSGFWPQVRAFDATVINFMGATLTLLYRQDPSAADRAHRVRLAWGVPMPDWQHDFERRFGFPLFQIYGLTDGGLPVYDPIDGTQRPGACGTVVAEYEVRVGDDEEIFIRGREPGLTMTGYYGMPDATAATIDADGWVRTGDRGRMDADGYLTFLGRLSDSIRRRGQNISAAEVEELVQGHPDILEAAAVGVPSDLTEEDVLAWAVLRPGAAITPGQLHEFCARTGPRFMVPRYLRLVAALPKTPTQKVEKRRLIEAGITADTWDSAAPS